MKFAYQTLPFVIVFVWGQRLHGAPVSYHNETSKIRLSGGNTELEGNVDILHNKVWGSICDDEWGLSEANVVCKQLGFSRGALRPTMDSMFGVAQRQMWLDNVKCVGTEKDIVHCRSLGWARHDCMGMEAAGVICKANLEKAMKVKVKIGPERIISPQQKIRSIFNESNRLKMTLEGGRDETEGRLEVNLPNSDQVGFICGDGWNLMAAMVVCKQLGFSYAKEVYATPYFGTFSTRNFSLMNVECNGDEISLDDCRASASMEGYCNGSERIAGVKCTEDLPDIFADKDLIEESIYLQDLALFYLQCSMEEHCLAPEAELLQKQSDYIFHSRRLLRFSTKVYNNGSADFRPDTRKEDWEWHQCHMHHHSMEIFSHYDILDPATGNKVAQGHKASFCLEDSDCPEGEKKVYNCQNYGDQGISVGCWDEYKHDIDCQWIDITEMKAGNFILKIAINPEMRVAESDFSNNAVVCDLYYNFVQAIASNCRYAHLKDIAVLSVDP